MIENLLKILTRSKYSITYLWKKFLTLGRPLQIVIVAGLVIVLALPRFLFQHEEMPQSKVVETYKATKGTIAQTTTLRGTVLAYKNFTATSGADGMISFIAPAGSHLHTGEVIAKIDNVPVEEAYHTATTAAKIAADQYNRQLSLLESKTSSRQAVEEKYTVLSNAKAALAAAKANYDKIVFLAPFDGIVGSALGHIGSHVKTGQEIVAFYDNKSFVVHFDIPTEIAKTLPEEPMVRINGKECRINFVQQALTSGTYTVPASITNFPCETCFSGEKIPLELTISIHRNVLIVPKSCILLRNQKNFIYKVKDGMLELVPVTLGIVEKDQVEVIEGVASGDEIILKGQYRLFPGMPVTIHKVSK